MSVTTLVGAVVLFVGAVVAWWCLPGKLEPVEEMAAHWGAQRESAAPAGGGRGSAVCGCAGGYRVMPSVKAVVTRLVSARLTVTSPNLTCSPLASAALPRRGAEHGLVALPGDVHRDGLTGAGLHLEGLGDAALQLGQVGARALAHGVHLAVDVNVGVVGGLVLSTDIVAALVLAIVKVKVLASVSALRWAVTS